MTISKVEKLSPAFVLPTLAILAEWHFTERRGAL